MWWAKNWKKNSRLKFTDLGFYGDQSDITCCFFTPYGKKRIEVVIGGALWEPESPTDERLECEKTTNPGRKVKWRFLNDVSHLHIEGPYFMNIMGIMPN